MMWSEWRDRLEVRGIGELWHNTYKQYLGFMY